MRLALDANRYCDFVRNVPEAFDRIGNAHQIYMPLPVIAELRGGFLAGSRTSQNESRLSEFLQSSRVRILYPDDATTHVYARLFAELKKAGTPIPTNDMWIAALVLQYNAVLFTRDRHFDVVPALAKV